jgi:hypothetical protein
MMMAMTAKRCRCSAMPMCGRPAARPAWPRQMVYVAGVGHVCVCRACPVPAFCVPCVALVCLEQVVQAAVLHHRSARCKQWHACPCLQSLRLQAAMLRHAAPCGPVLFQLPPDGRITYTDVPFNQVMCC